MRGESSVRQPQRWRQLLEVATSLAMLVAAVLLIWATVHKVLAHQTPPEPPLPSKPIPIAGAQLLGERHAPVVVTLFSDFECPYCAKLVAGALQEVRRDYVSAGKVLLAFRTLPLESIHPHSRAAAESAICAGRQGQFWVVHDAFFQRPELFASPLILREFTLSIHLDEAQFQRCLAEQAGQLVSADLALAHDLEVTVTPTSFLGVAESDGLVRVTDRVTGAKPFDSFRTRIEHLLASRSGVQKAP